MTKRYVLQGVLEDYVDTRPSSEMRCTRFEACEEDINTSDNETKCGEAVSKQLIASEYCIVQIMNVNIARAGIAGVKSQL